MPRVEGEQLVLSERDISSLIAKLKISVFINQMVNM